MDLIEQVDVQSFKIRTKSSDISFNELYDMYTEGELTIAPAYQRLFRWDIEKRSRLIESLILEMPIPPIFVIEREEDGVYELIDGLQRVSSYLHFRGAEGVIKGSDVLGEDGYYEPLRLSGCEIVPQLNGLTFNELPQAIKMKLKRHFIRVEVIKKGSEQDLKYHMFKRLNTGGEILSEQEVRNATIRLMPGGEKAIDFINRCSENKDFQKTIKHIDDKKAKNGFDKELVLRFFALKNDLESYRKPFGEYLTDYLEKMAANSTFDYEAEESNFVKVFEFIGKHWGEDAFSSKNARGAYTDKLILYYFDGISVAVSRWIEEISTGVAIEEVIKRIDVVKMDKELMGAIKTGHKANISKRIDLFSGAIDGKSA